MTKLLAQAEYASMGDTSDITVFSQRERDIAAAAIMTPHCAVIAFAATAASTDALRPVLALSSRLKLGAVISLLWLLSHRLYATESQRENRMRMLLC
jgi:hypothetical protein